MKLIMFTWPNLARRTSTLSWRSKLGSALLRLSERARAVVISFVIAEIPPESVEGAERLSAVRNCDRVAGRGFVGPMAAVQPGGRDLRELRILAGPGFGVAAGSDDQLVNRRSPILQRSIEGLPGGDLSIAPRVRLPPLVEG
ncbi:hypothetical protein [Methylobacterium sp. GC_Met_2]|uniref:hypothetical protein n=1 Tax=Methylobacterium sp. GC_Met_2 TaxID=2937376 RepID=UPI00226B9371|nr:hypothetical protein [Methylobacterium sp. GC_Met_2]